MRNWLKFAAAMLGMTPALAPALEPGDYLCLAERSVGIVPVLDGFYHGKVKASIPQFVLRIEQAGQEAVPEGLPKDALCRLYICDNVQFVASVPTDKTSEYPLAEIAHLLSPESGDGVSLTFRGVNTTLHVRSDGWYSLAKNEGQSGSYLEAGTCKPPSG